MKSLGSLRLADVAYTEWPVTSTNALGLYWWAAGQHCPSDREVQEQPWEEYGEHVLSTPALSNGSVTRDCDADMTEGTERGENLVEAGSSMLTKIRECVLMMVPSMTRVEEHRSVV